MALVASVTGLMMFGSSARATTTWNDAESVSFAGGVAATSNQWSDVWSVSCPTAGNCTAVGEFTNTAGGYEGFTARSTNGTWQQAQTINFGSGVAAAGANAASATKSVSCASVSFCAAVGSVRTTSASGIEAFAITYSNGSWSTATLANFGSLAQQASQYATFTSVSCPASGSCVAVGQFTDSNSKVRAFTMTMTNGSWGSATPASFGAGVNVPRTMGYTGFMSVSCASAGNCVAGGSYDTAFSTKEAFTMTMSNGSWGQAAPVEFPAGLQSSSRESDVLTVSCASVGYCIASGGVTASAGNYTGFTVVSTNGVWGTAQAIQFSSSLQPAGGYSYVYSSTCSSVGNCVAAGEFENLPYGQSEAFVMTMTNGVWGSPTPVAFAAGVQKTNRQGYLQAVVCPSDGNCTAVGQFWDQANDRPAFSVSMTNGVWGQAIPIAFPVGVQNNAPQARARAVSCASPGNCVAGGYFLDSSSGGNYQGLLASSVNNSVQSTSTSTTLPSVTTTVAPTTTIANTFGITTTTSVATSISRSGNLPSTGRETFGWVLYAGFAMTLAGGLVVAGRRHRARAMQLCSGTDTAGNPRP